MEGAPAGSMFAPGYDMALATALELKHRWTLLHPVAVHAATGPAVSLLVVLDNALHEQLISCKPHSQDKGQHVPSSG